ncbi:hypothetical protein D3C72_1244850 [compost metagenome]
MVAHDITAAHGGKTDAAIHARAGIAIALVHRAVGELGALGIGNHLAHLQRRTGRRIHLVLVVRFDDFDVVAAVLQRLGCHLEQLEGDIDAHAHVRGEDDGRLLGHLGNLRLLRVIEARGANDHAHAFFSRYGQMGQRALRAREVDQHVGIGERLAHIGRHGNPRGFAQKSTGIGAQAGVACGIQRTGQSQVGAGKHGFDQHVAHAAAGASNGNADGGWCGGSSGSHETVPVARAACPLHRLIIINLATSARPASASSYQSRYINAVRIPAAGSCREP